MFARKQRSYYLLSMRSTLIFQDGIIIISERKSKKKRKKDFNE